MADEGKKKPNVIIFIANFKTIRASFAQFDAAVAEIESCKDAGAWVVVIIVDEEANR